MLGEPTATLQYVRKISGFRGTRQAQAEAFCHAIDAVVAGVLEVTTAGVLGLTTVAGVLEVTRGAAKIRRKAAARMPPLSGGLHGT